MSRTDTAVRLIPPLRPTERPMPGAGDCARARPGSHRSVPRVSRPRPAPTEPLKGGQQLRLIHGRDPNEDPLTVLLLRKGNRRSPPVSSSRPGREAGVHQARTIGPTAAFSGARSTNAHGAGALPCGAHERPDARRHTRSPASFGLEVTRGDSRPQASPRSPDRLPWLQTNLVVMNRALCAGSYGSAPIPDALHFPSG
jgi:hypothetical protein